MAQTLPTARIVSFFVFNGMMVYMPDARFLRTAKLTTRGGDEKT